jgi:hypothetical protein
MSKVDEIAKNVFKGIGFLTNDFQGMFLTQRRSHISRHYPSSLLREVQERGSYYDKEALDLLIQLKVNLKSDKMVIVNEWNTKIVKNHREVSEFLKSQDGKLFRYVRYVNQPRRGKESK